MEKKQKEFNRALVGTRPELLRKDETWYLQRPMTGAEAMRVAEIALTRWNLERPNDEVQWLSMTITSDFSLKYDWAMSIEEMLDEKEAGWDFIGAPDWYERKRFEPCKCCDKCKYKE